MGNDWNTKTTIITGGAGDLGLATAKRLQRKGAKIALFDNRLKVLEKAASQLNLGVLIYEVDVTDIESVIKAVDEVASTWQTIDILINAAGITGETNIKSHEISLDDFERVWAINVKGSLTTFKAVAPYMLQ